MWPAHLSHPLGLGICEWAGIKSELLFVKSNNNGTGLVFALAREVTVH